MSEGRSAASRYSELESSRMPFLTRARDASRLTIPTMYPPAGHNGTTLLPTPYQAVGARGVNNLSARLLLTLFPPNTPFFRFEYGEIQLEKQTGQQGLQGAVDAALAKIEREVQTEFETSAMRPTCAEVLKHLIVAGNCLVHMKDDGSLRYYNLENFVVRRDPSGNVLEIIARDMVSRDSVPVELKPLLQKANIGKGQGAGGENPADSAVPDTSTSSGDTSRAIAIYTWIRRGERHWHVHQEMEGELIPGSEGSYPFDKTPWIPLRWVKIDNEDYGRGFVEEYQGDLQSLEGLTQAITEGAAAAAKILILVNPNGVTKLKTVSDAPNGAVRAGREQDVTVVQSNKQSDFATAERLSQTIEQRLSMAFLLNSAVQRQGERVTAAEIRYAAQELETALGGLYSLLSQEFQLPLVKVLVFRMERKKKLPPIPHKLVKPTIVTGMEALGRGNDLDRLDQFMQQLSPLGPQVIAQYLVVSEYISRVATGAGIDPAGLIKPQDQVDKEQQQAMMQAAGQNLTGAVAPHLAKAAGDILTHNATTPAQAPQGQGQQANG